MDNNQIQELIRSFLDDVSNLTVSGQDCNFSIKIVSKDFTNMSTLERHKSIMKLFSDLLKSGELHAISLDLKAPSEV
jgi:Predicted transcriptional regulator, BolA superfamily|tara:strand:- start:276 stop:506 length:231 start_codon:yes stop_codon:yes gene_type:complete